MAEDWKMNNITFIINNHDYFFWVDDGTFSNLKDISNTSLSDEEQANGTYQINSAQSN